MVADPARLAAAFKSSALDAAGRLLDLSFDQADEGLRELTADVEYDPDVFDACEEAARLARDERAKLTMVFIQVLGEGLSGQGVGEVGDEALLPPDEADEVVRAGKMAGRLIEDCADELEALEARLAALADQTDVAATAISPTALCQSFRQAMQTVGGRPEAKHMLYGLFERSLRRHLGRVYQGLDAELARHGVAAKRQRGRVAEADHERPPKSAHWARQLTAARRAVSPENEFGAGEILAALAALADRLEAWQSPRQLIDALLAQLRRRQRDTSPRTLPPQARRQLGLAMAWWGDLHADPAVPAPARPLLERLRPTLLEIALLDDGLFRDPDNPARHMVNELVTLAAPGETDIWRRAGVLAERVASDFKQRPGVVTAAAKALARRRPPSQAAAVSRARRVAVLELRQQALGRPPPPAIQPFLLKGWAPVLARAYLEGGAVGPTWYTSVSRLSRLLDLVQPPAYGADREARVRAQRGVAREIRAQLLDRGVSRGRIADYVGALEESFAAANRTETVAAPEVETFDDPVAWDADATVFDDSGDYEAADAFAQAGNGGTAAEPLAPRTASALLGEACKPGRWFQVHTGGEGAIRWLRIMAYDPDGRVVAFGNRRGETVYERDASEFAEDLRAGRSRPIYEAEAFESRLAAIIGEHSRSLG